MEHLAPLVQTILWVGLIAVVVWRFHRPIEGILSGLHKRIEEGSSVKAGGFELSELQPQNAIQQKEKAAEEIREVLRAESTENDDPKTADTSLGANFQATYFQAEDLALRAIQAEYGKAVKRQVTAGSDVGFDAAFTTGGRLNIVEVKYVRAARNLGQIRGVLERLAETIQAYHWRNVQIILAVVFEGSSGASEGVQLLEEMAAGVSVSVVIRCYGLDDLRRRFGVAID